ncbi:MAG: hypothetical protein COA59_03235 [Colwellia sp.]|nr:MAG: hypothetical protein COA59_03235 [Colwellia sp.]
MNYPNVKKPFSLEKNLLTSNVTKIKDCSPRRSPSFKIFMHKQLLVITVSIFLLSCAETHTNITTNKAAINTDNTKTRSVKYTCNRATKLSINFTSKNKENHKHIAIINGYGEQAIILPSKKTTSGFLYSNGKYTLRGKGEQATWTVGRMADFQCSVGDKLIPQKSIK